MSYESSVQLEKKSRFVFELIEFVYKSGRSLLRRLPIKVIHQSFHKNKKALIIYRCFLYILIVSALPKIILRMKYRQK